MGSGTPDYISQTRDVYGSGVHECGSEVVTASGVTLIKEIIGKGMIYGGIVYLAHTASQKDSNPAIYIDGTIILSSTFELMNRFCVYDPRTYPLVINLYDDRKFEYAMSLAYGIKFEKSFKIVYEESHAETPTVYYGINYALLS